MGAIPIPGNTVPIDLMPKVDAIRTNVVHGDHLRNATYNDFADKQKQEIALRRAPGAMLFGLEKSS